MNALDMKGRVAVVTGGASGIGERGQRLAAELAAAGAKSGAYLIASSSTSKISVALGGMTPPAPRSP